MIPVTKVIKVKQFKLRLLADSIRIKWIQSKSNLSNLNNQSNPWNPNLSNLIDYKIRLIRLGSGGIIPVTKVK